MISLVHILFICHSFFRHGACHRCHNCDGSHVVYATNPQNTNDYVKPQKEGDKGYNQLHLNALYDIVNRTFVDAIIQPGVKQDEHLALYDMLEHFEPYDPSHTILTVDRGYESYNLIAQLSEKKMRYVIRAIDFTCISLLSSFIDECPDSDEFDIRIRRFISRSKSKPILNNSKVYSISNQAKTFGILILGIFLLFIILIFELYE